jgi:hypothetical protein
MSARLGSAADDAFDRHASCIAATMSHPDTIASTRPLFELRFVSLFQEGRGLAFPCDETGRVDLDALSERARQFYLYARRAVGREYGFPMVQRQDPAR